MNETSLQIRLFAKNNTDYRNLPLSSNGKPGVISVEARVTQEEGYAEATLVLSGKVSDYPGLKRRRRVESWGIYRARANGSVQKDRMHRGIIKRVEPGKDKAGLRTVTVKIFGLWSEISNIPCYKRYANNSGGDRSSFFSDLANLFIVPKIPGLVVQSNPVSSIPEYVDGYDKSFGEITETLRQNLGQIATGTDVDDLSTADRVFYRPFDSLSDPARHTLLLPDRQGGEQTPESDNTGQATILVLRGGPLKNGNLLAEAVQGNTGFETPQLPGLDSAGNYLSNASFEEGGDTSPAHWTLIGGATTKDRSNKQIQPFTGNRYLEMDHVNEGAKQEQFVPAQPLVEGRTYTIDCRARLQNFNRPVTGQLIIEWFADDMGTILVDTTVIPILPTNITWDLFGQSMALPSGATAFAVTVKCDTRGTLGDDSPDDGYCLLVDEVRFFDPSQTTQQGWEFWRGDGAAFARTLRWDEDIVRWQGSRSVYLDVSSTDADGQDCHLQPTGRNRFTVTPGQQISAGFLVMVPLGAPAMNVFVEIDEWDKDGNISTSPTKSHYTVPGDGQWHVIYATRSLAGDAAAQATMFLVFRSSGRIYVDAAFAYDAAVSVPDFADSGTYVEGTQYRGTFRADALFGTGTAINDEAIEVGDIVVTEDRAEITTDSEGLTYANAYFQRYALPLTRPTLETYGIIETSSGGASTASMMPGESVRVVGSDKADFLPVPLPLVEKVIRFQDGKLTIGLHLSAEPRDPFRVIEAMIRKQRLAGTSTNAANSYGSGFSSGSNSGGGGGTGIENASDTTIGITKLSATPASASNPIAVGVNDPGFTAAVATTAELVAARTRPAIAPFAANTYASLYAHLSGIWTAIANLCNRTITAGTGLTGGGDLTADRTIGIAIGGVGTTQIADSSVTSAKISGTIAIAQGGTGSTTAATARTALGLGTASTYDAPASGNAASTQVVLGSDSRLVNAGQGTLPMIDSNGDLLVNSDGELIFFTFDL